MKHLLRNLFQFYYQGFKSMTIGRKLWAIILIKVNHPVFGAEIVLLSKLFKV